MRSLLMHRDRDFLNLGEIPRPERYRDYGPPHLSQQQRALMQDLELDVVLRAMAADDPFLHEVARKALLSGFPNDTDTILYRQAVTKDCLKNPQLVRQIYALTVETIEAKKKHWWGISSHFAGSILRSAVDLMQMFMGMLRRLRDIADAHADDFESQGFKTLFATLDRELSDEYFARVDHHLAELRFSGGVMESAQLGTGNAGINYVLRQSREKGPNWLQRLLGRGPVGYTFHLHPRDEAGPRIVSEMRDRGVNLVANALAQSADHVQTFFEMLRVELAFYVGCLNLHDRLSAMGAPTCFPEAAPLASRRHRLTDMYDVSLALTMGHRVVGNTVDADRKDLVIITGANKGGKSSFLRSIGSAQVMMQSGMFVGAKSFTADLCTGLFTHYKREEDATMRRGKLDEEISRMSDLVDAIRPDSLVLFNESFASTTEREGSEIARQVVHALLEKRIKIFYVTHLYDFAHRCFATKSANAIFLRAERQHDGTRTFKLVEGEPRATSYGEDLYQEIFEAVAHGAVREPLQKGGPMVTASAAASTQSASQVANLSEDRW